MCALSCLLGIVGIRGDGEGMAGLSFTSRLPQKEAASFQTTAHGTGCSFLKKAAMVQRLGGVRTS